MGENVALISEIKQNETGGIVALIEPNWTYTVSYNVSGECNLDLKIRDSVTNKLLLSVTKFKEHLDGSYSFPFVSLKGGVLVYDFSGTNKGVITNIKVIKGGR